ncbi:hypothetical protein NMY22_g13669 [Coprinellus aureogranulatus]|nr:hypothetical protein NMY22_g13669 [Coprinellus aureogranulatus]
MSVEWAGYHTARIPNRNWDVHHGRDYNEVATVSSAQSTVIGNTTATASTTSTSTAFPSLSTYPACVSNCLNMAVAGANCSSVVEVDCFCTKPEFVQELFRCITTDCRDDLSSSEQLAQEFCNIASSSPSLTFPAFTPTTSSTSTQPPSSTTTPPKQSDVAGNSAGHASSSWQLMTALLASALIATLSGFLVA